MKRFSVGLAVLVAAVGGCQRQPEVLPASLLSAEPSSGGGTIFVIKTYRPEWATFRETGPSLAVSCTGERTHVALTATLAPPKPPPLRGVFAQFRGAGFEWSAEMAYLWKSDWFVGRDEDHTQRAGLAKALAAGPVVMTAETGWGLGDTLEWRLPDTPLAAEFRRQCAGA